MPPVTAKSTASLSDALLALDQGLSRSTSVEAGLACALEAIIDLTGATFGSGQLPDREGTLLLAVHHNMESEFCAVFARVRSTQATVCGRAFAQGRSVQVEDVMCDEAFAPFRSVAERQGFRAVLSTPCISLRGELQAMLSVHFRQPGRRPEADMVNTYLLARRAADWLEYLRGR